MRIDQLTMEDIEFSYTPYSDALQQSVLRMGFAFPIQVRKQGSHYLCLDGHKRLSILQDMQDSSLRFHNIPVVIMNSARSASTKSMNHH